MIEVEGVNEIAKLLDEFPREVVDKAVSPSMRRAATPVVRAIRRGYKMLRMPYSTRQLSRSIGSKSKKYKQTGTVVVYVGPRSGFKQQMVRPGSAKSTIINPTKYAHLVEFGFYHTRSQRFIPGRPVIRSTWDRNRNKYMEHVHTQFEKELPRQVERLARKHRVKRGQ